MTLITILSFYLQGLLVTHLMVTLFCTFFGTLKANATLHVLLLQIFFF